MGRRAGLWAAAAVVLGALGLVAPARAQPGQTVALASSVELLPPYPALAAPADGRLNGVGIHTHIEGAQFFAGAGPAGTNLAAAPGTELLVLRLAGHDDGTDLPWADASLDDRPAAVTVVAGTTRIPMPVAGDFDAADAFGVPAGAPVHLELARAGYVQTFDLRAGRRIGVSPAALYRDPMDLYVTATPNATETLTASASPGGQTVSFRITLKSAELGYFPPAGVSLPDADHGVLAVDFGVEVPGQADALLGDETGVRGPLPGSAVRLVLDDGTTAPAAHQDVGPETGLLGGQYWFVVPARLDHAEVVVDPGPAVAGRLNVGFTEARAVTLAFSGMASFDVVLPPPPAAPLGGPTAPPAVLGVRHGGGLPLGLIALAVLVVAAGAVAVLRRRGLAPRPLVHTQAALMASLGPAMLVGATTPLALPPATAAADEADDTPAPGGPRLVVRLLGPLEIEGLRRRLRRVPSRRLLVLLALELDRALSADVLRYRLATSADADPSESALYGWASALRSALPEGLLPAHTPGGYRLGAGIEVDWAIFCALTERARAEPHDRFRCWRAALSLVRGEPLAELSWPGIDDAVLDMTATVERVAGEAAEAWAAAGDSGAADWAIAQGLRAVPQSRQLWDLRLAMAARSGDGLAQVWARVRRVLSDDPAALAELEERYRLTR